MVIEGEIKDQRVVTAWLDSIAPRLDNEPTPVQQRPATLPLVPCTQQAHQAGP
jgi:hypothetical protein